LKPVPEKFIALFNRKKTEMKKFILIIFCTALGSSLLAQEENKPKSKSDTIKVGGLIIITNKDKSKSSGGYGKGADTRGRNWDGAKKRKKSNQSSNWFVVDLGFTNLIDESVYTSPEVTSVLRATSATPAPTESDLKLRTGKSVNVNVWIFMQKLSVIKNVLNLKYGIGLELNNYRYKTPLSFKDASPAYIIRDSISFTKNKLAVDYVTVPMMLNINPSGKGGFSISGGMSVGYRYSARNKQISDSRGKEKERGDFGLNPWKLAVVGDIGWRSLRFYGSYALTGLYEKGLKMTPYSVGLRFSSW
jgi:Outer membrane protein beta-barrel domain